MRSWSVLCLLVLAVAAFAAPPAYTEEFVGPFPSWKNVKTDYGAKGDGVADDTAAIQKALDELRFHKDFCVLYFPAGTYRITNTIGTKRAAHHECMGITVIGEDPATTIIKWDGPDGGIMFKYDAWYSKISRLTLDGAGKAGNGVLYGDAFSTYNETSDMVFKDVGNGWGSTGFGQAENAVLRCQFVRCKTGIQTNNFNTLDIWAWYCTFEDCDRGLWNGAGNFHAYQCLFLRSKTADIGTANLMVFSFVNNTSIGSKCFMDWQSGHSWGSPTTISGNRVIEPTGDWALRLGNGGPYLVLDNVIKARADAKTPYVGMTWGDQVFAGNSYSLPNAVAESGRYLSLGEKIVDPKNIDVTPPVMPPAPPHRDRKVFEVALTADAAAVQAAIADAAKLAGQRPVLHFPKGIFKINQTLTVPAGCDLQIVGDGASEDSTVLQWTGAAGAPLLLLEGPSVAAVRDLSIQAGPGIGIRLSNCDQPGGKIFADQLNIPGQNHVNQPIGLLVNGVEDSDVQLWCLQGATDCKTWVKVIGGAKLSAGKPANGQVNIYCGATGSADAQYAVEQGGKLVVRSVYHEMSGDAPQGILLNDSGNLLVDATRFSYKTSPTTPLIKTDGFKGKFAMFTGLLLPVNSTTTAQFETAGDGARSKVLAMCDLFTVYEPGVTSDAVFRNTAVPPAAAAMFNCNWNSGTKGIPAFAYIENRGIVSTPFLREMLQPLRDARVWMPQESQPGLTNVQMHRLIVTAGKDGIDVELTPAK